MDQDAQNQGEALHYFGEGSYKVSLNITVYIALHVVLLIIKIKMQGEVTDSILWSYAML